MSHYEERLEADLKRIRGRVSALSTAVQTALNDAVHALLTDDRSLASATILADGPINRQMREIDAMCHRFIAVHLPSAGPLRLISSVIRINIMLERIGDYAVTICRELHQLSGKPTGAAARGVELMAQEARTMLAQAVRAYEEGNAELARGTMTMAHQVEVIFNTVFAELLQEQHQGLSLNDRFALFVVYHRLGRVADQAKNLCEEAVFAATGQSKAKKSYRILFLDHDNSCLAPMAVAIAASNFANSGVYTSAGKTAAAALLPALHDYLGGRGVDMSERTPSKLDLAQSELAELHVIVSLQGPIDTYLDKVPFHTTVLEWDLGDVSHLFTDAADQQGEFETVYRDLAVRIQDLMILLRGDGAD